MKRNLVRTLRSFSRLLVIALAVLFGAPAGAVALYGQGSGLPNLSVQSVDLDEKGFLWLATEDGALRFDGHRFLKIDLSGGDGPPDLHLRKVAALPGAIYFSSGTRVHRYDLATHRVTVVRGAGVDLAEGNGFARRPDGFVYVGLENAGVWRWREQPDGATFPQRVAIRSDEDLGPIYALDGTPDALWLSTEKGLYRFDPDTGRATPVRFPEPAIKDGAVRATAAYEFPRGVLWIGYWNDALVRLDLATGEHRWFHPAHEGAGALRSTSIFGFASRPDRLYIATNRGVAVYRNDCACIRGLNDPSWDQMDGVGVVAVAVVPEGDGLWTGIWGRGLARFSAADEVIQHQVKMDRHADGLAHPMVYALDAAPDGTLWIGTYGGGVQWSSPEKRVDGGFWPLGSIAWGDRRIESKFVWSLTLAGDELTAGTGFGLFHYRDGRLSEVQPQKPIESVRSYLVTHDGRRYVGTQYGLLREEGGAARPVPLADPAGGAALSPAIWSLSEHGDEVWLGTAAGLARLDRDEKITALHRAGTGPDQLPGSIVWVQKRDASGHWWLGTSGGLVDVDERGATLRFARHEAIERTNIKDIHSIEFDTHGRAWLGTPSGLLRYRIADQRVDLYDHTDGLVSDQLNFNASAFDGKLMYFGGMGGFIAFDPDAMPERRARLTPRIARLRLGHGAWSIDASELDLPSGHEPIQAELTSLYFTHPEQVRYAYRWRETETTFTELGDAQSAVFSRLPAGSHTLEIRASLVGDPSVAAVADVLHARIAPAWFETWWGRAAILIGAAALALAYAQRRSAQARAYARELEAQVKERTRQLSAASEALVLANERLSQQVKIDPLTGLSNRRALFDYTAAIAARGEALAALMCDLDHFKQINDHHGHETGDRVLRDFAELLREQVAESASLAARYGGEEFVVVLVEGAIEAAPSIARRLLDEVRARRVSAGTVELRYTVSIGVALGAAGEGAETVLRRADEALYRAKREGRDRSMT